MKALTLTQPWATLVAIGAKRIETRSWSTSYRGPLAIHAAKGLGPVGGKRGLMEQCAIEPFNTVLKAAGERHYAQHTSLRAMAEHPFMPLGMIVAVCNLYDCVPVDMPMIYKRGFAQWAVPPGNISHEYAFGDYTPGRFAWLLADIEPLSEPIPAKGALGLWEWNR